MNAQSPAGQLPPPAAGPRPRRNGQQRQRILSLCGLIAPPWFILTAVLGGALRPGYSHLSNTISELFTRGSPNKPLLDTLHTTFAVLLVLFGIGILQLVRGSERPSKAASIGAWAYIAMGALSISTATVFPQDPWGSAPTFPGQMHQVMSGVITPLTLVAMLLVGRWVDRVGLMPGFWLYSIVTSVAAVIAAGFLVATVDTPIMGLTERVAALVGFQWTFVLAWQMAAGRVFSG